MADLDESLEAARASDPGSRILFRDSIAEYGQVAIGPMTSWVHDPRLGAFAVRVLERIAADPTNRDAALTALAKVDRQRLGSAVAHDVLDALARLRPARALRGSGPKQPAASHHPDRSAGSDVEAAFDDAMLSIYWLAGGATGYWANYFLRSVRDKGGLAAARELLRKAGTSPGFARLTAEGRLDLSMEALVLSPDFASLFTPAEIALARVRLVAAGYHP